MNNSIKQKRKIVQVSAAVTTVEKVDEYLEYQATEPYLVALCDDGTAWELNEHGNWYKLPDIPQDGCDDHLTFHKTGCNG